MKVTVLFKTPDAMDAAIEDATGTEVRRNRTVEQSQKVLAVFLHPATGKGWVMGLEIDCQHCGTSYDSEQHKSCPVCEEKHEAELESMRQRRRRYQIAPGQPTICECPVCKEPVSVRALSCPHCGEPSPVSFMPLAWRTLFIIFVANVWTAALTVLIWMIVQAR